MDGLAKFPHLAQRLFNCPLIIHPSKAEVIMAALSERLGLTQIVRINGDVILGAPMAFDQELENESRTRQDAENYRARGYDVIAGVARIEVEGTLVQRNGALRPESGMTGYDGIRQNFIQALGDPGVQGIMLAIDSPGGEVAGCFDLTDQIRAARGSKPIWAVLCENACSAAYALASATDKIIVPRTGVVGSIGVIWMHVDLSQMFEKAGVKVTIVKRGARKADGAPEIPLTGEALAHFQAQIDTIGELFEDVVSRGRGLRTKKIRDMDAATFLGAEGVEVGLADAVMSPDAAFRAMVEAIN